jgi:accessory gene regulator B
VEEVQMIKQFADTITSFLLKEAIINEEDREIYQFGTARILKDIIIILMIGTMATVFNAWVETIFITIGFLPLRRIAGGYHADTLLGCNVITVSVYLMNLIIIRAMSDYITIDYFVMLSVMTIILIFKYAPVDHRNFVFTKERAEKAKKAGKLIVLLIVITTCGYNYIESKVELVSLSTMMGAFSASISVFIGSMRRRREKDEEISIST